MNNKAKNDDLIREFLNCGDYIVNNNGEIFSHISLQGHRITIPRKLNLKLKPNGYFLVSYKRTTLAVHRIVYQARIGELSENLQINHLDGNPANNHPSNLELITPSANLKHSYRTLKRAPVCANAKLSREQVLRMRHLRDAQGWSYNRLVKEFGTVKSNVADIVKRRTWIEV